MWGPYKYLAGGAALTLYLVSQLQDVMVRRASALVFSSHALPLSPRPCPGLLGLGARPVGMGWRRQGGFEGVGLRDSRLRLDGTGHGLAENGALCQPLIPLPLLLGTSSLATAC